MTYNPELTWEIDWDGDGNYNNPYADVSRYVESWEIDYGCQPNLSSGGVSVAYATGVLVLNNADQRYNPDSALLLVDESKLRRRNSCRLLDGTTVVWAGTASPTSRNVKLGGSMGWQLEGKHAEVLVRGDRELDKSGLTIAGLSQAFSTASGISLSAAGTQKTGQVVFRGSWLYFLQDFARFAGGWVLEDRLGEFLFRQWTETPGLVLAGTLSEAFGPLEDGLLVSERVGHVRNHAICRGLVWAASESATLAFSTVTMGPNEQRWVAMIFEPSRQARPSEWSSYSVSDTKNFSILGTAKKVSENVYNVRVQSGSFTGHKSVTITATGSIERRRETSEREIEIKDYDTQEVFGQKTLRLPPWFPSSFDGLHTHTLPWLRNLSQPPSFIRATYPAVQSSVGMWESLRDALQPGNAVNITVPIEENATITFPALIMQIKLDGGWNRATTKTVIGIKRQSVPAAPLWVSVVDVADTSANVIVGVPSPNDQAVYGRVRTA